MATSETAPTHVQGSTTELARDLRLFDITMGGVGAMIGAGIFALTGLAVGERGKARSRVRLLWFLLTAALAVGGGAS